MKSEKEGTREGFLWRNMFYLLKYFILIVI